MIPTEKPLLSVVLPAYQAADVLAGSLPTLLEYLRSLDVSYEVIVVDDGSCDRGRTRAVAESFACRYYELPYNAGKGAAVRRGMLEAAGRYRIFTDADVPFELDVIRTILYYLDFQEFHVAAGDRTLPESRYASQVSLGRRIASSICSTTVGRFIATGWFDTQCGVKGFQDWVAQDVFGVARINRFAFDVELFYVSLKRNYDIKRIPVRLRSNETSSVRLVSDGFGFIRDLARIRWNQFRGRYAAAQRRSPAVS